MIVRILLSLQRRTTNNPCRKSLGFHTFKSSNMKHQRAFASVVLFALIHFTFIYIHQQKPPMQRSSSNDSRFYTRCHYTPVPYVATLLETAQFLLLTNNSFARFGNTEFDLMMGIDWYYQKAYKNLSEALLTVFTSNIPNISIGVPDMLSGASELAISSIDWFMNESQYSEFLLQHLHLNRQYLNAFITAINFDLHGTFCSLIEEVYRTLREIWRDKNIILVRGDNGEQYEYNIYDTARSITEIIAPPRHAWDEYLTIKGRLLLESSSALYILAAGPISKVLVYELTFEGRRALDLGHLAKDYNSYMTGIIPPNFWHASINPAR